MMDNFRREANSQGADHLFGGKAPPERSRRPAMLDAVAPFLATRSAVRVCGRCMPLQRIEELDGLSNRRWCSSPFLELSFHARFDALCVGPSCLTRCARVQFRTRRGWLLRRVEY